MLLLDLRAIDWGFNVFVGLDEILLERGNGSSQGMDFCSSVMREKDSKLINVSRLEKLLLLTSDLMTVWCLHSYDLSQLIASHLNSYFRSNGVGLLN